MVTILSFQEVADIPRVRVTRDTNKQRGMMVSLKWKVFQVQGVRIWLYFYDTENKDDEAEENINVNKNTIIDYSFPQTMK